jgi:hypothetical protein
MVRSRSLFVVEVMICIGGWRAESGQRGAAHGPPPHVSVGKYLGTVSDPVRDDRRLACDTYDNEQK